MTSLLSNFVPPLCFIALSVFVWTDADRYTALGSVFPRTMAAAMAICSVLILIRSAAALRANGRTSSPTERSGGESLWRPLALLVIFGLWLFAMNTIGFIVSSAVAFVALTLIAERETFAPKRLVLIVVVGLGGIVGVAALMSDVLMVPLPRGILF